uniref:Putative secreted peptide n=1 Tax=Anopheles braziliensis TaxID=58242 RepID=A0A2M3ZUB3_9DIPT
MTLAAAVAAVAAAFGAVAASLLRSLLQMLGLPHRHRTHSCARLLRCWDQCLLCLWLESQRFACDLLTKR